MGGTLFALLFALVFWTDNDDGDGGVLETVSAHGAGEEALNATEGAAACTYDEGDGGVDFDLCMDFSSIW